MAILDTSEPTAPGASADFLARQEARQAELFAQIHVALPPGPITLEIGCGHGHYLTAYAKNRAETCVGIDICRDRIARAARKRDRASLGNLFFFRCDADDFLAMLAAVNSVSRVLILFPDPWPKRRHHKNRLLSSPFLSAIAAKTTSECDLYFRTDHRPYFEAVVELVASHTDWRLAPDLPWPFEQTTVFQNRADSFSSLAALRREREGETRTREYPSRPSGTPGSHRSEPAASR